MFFIFHEEIAKNNPVAGRAHPINSNIVLIVVFCLCERRLKGLAIALPVWNVSRETGLMPVVAHCSIHWHSRVQGID